MGGSCALCVCVCVCVSRTIPGDVVPPSFEAGADTLLPSDSILPCLYVALNFLCFRPQSAACHSKGHAPIASSLHLACQLLSVAHKLAGQIPSARWYALRFIHMYLPSAVFACSCGSAGSPLPAR